MPRPLAMSQQLLAVSRKLAKSRKPLVSPRLGFWRCRGGRRGNDNRRSYGITRKPAGEVNAAGDVTAAGNPTLRCPTWIQPACLRRYGARLRAPLESTYMAPVICHLPAAGDVTAAAISCWRCHCRWRCRGDWHCPGHWTFGDVAAAGSVTAIDDATAVLVSLLIAAGSVLATGERQSLNVWVSTVRSMQ